MVFAIVVLSMAVGFLIIERIIIRRSVTALQMRIHINGTRGKSSVVRYIAAGLSETDPAVLAKVTGVVPSLISSGIVQVLGRTGVARVQEQFNIIRLASRRGIKKLVLECMSISPDLQQLESRVFKPHIYVITNIKDDHRENMGSSIREQAESICNAIPASCTVVTNETRFLDLIKEKAAKLNSTVVVPEIDKTIVYPDLPYGIFAENLALALTVCILAGVDSKSALKGILNSARAEDSPHRKIKAGAGELNFLNAFAVNDVESTESFIRYWREKLNPKQKYSIIFNTRADRPLRTDQLTSWIGDRSLEIEKVMLTGTHGERAFRKLKKSSINNNNIQLLRLK
ncbi:MAG: poly-gamma-glutamate synthase PgsB, partial [Bacteroidales bacterium]|nr:poly-gamma-glutamate synthase PgsB [Bacteroidales bacterium]